VFLRPDFRIGFKILFALWKGIEMSFNTVCDGCGAPSSPSVGVCPFCKVVMAGSTADDNHTYGAFVKLYTDGNLERALNLGNEMLKSKPELKADALFVMTFVKVLIESEAPTSTIRSILAEAHLLSPANLEISEYLEVIEAKGLLKKGLNNAGELMLRNILRRSPQNVHAHFFLGANLFWGDNEPTMAIPHLETCVRLCPNFLRAWGCLAALYKKMGNSQLAQKAFQKCASIETNPNMKEFFESQGKAA
jgi:predicted Zn-dependent protease